MRSCLSSIQRLLNRVEHWKSAPRCRGWRETRPVLPPVLTLILGALAWLAPTALCPAAPPEEIKQMPELRYGETSVWFDSMLASRTALQADESAGRRPAPKVSYHSEVVRGRQPAQAVSVPIGGAEEIYLYVTGAPDVEYGAGDWIAPRAIDTAGKETLLCSGKFLNIQQGFHTVDCSLRSRVDPPLLIADEMFEHGINLQAPGKIRVTLPKGTVRLDAKIGIDDWVTPETYKLPQPYYYQPHHFSTAALHEGPPADDSPPKGAVRFHIADAAGAARLDLWTRLAEEFSEEIPRQQMKWEREDRLLEEDWELGDWRTLAMRYAEASGRVAGMRAEALREAEKVVDRATFDRVRAIYHRSRQIDQAVSRAAQLDYSAVRDAVRDLITTHGAKYPHGQAYLERLARLESQIATALESCRKGQNAGRSAKTVDTELHTGLLDLLERFETLRRAALTSNPLLDWDQLLLVRRTPHGDPRRAMGRGYGVAEYLGYPRQSSKCNPGIEQPLNWENDLCTLSPTAPDGEIKTLYQPDGRRLLKDLDLDWDAERILFSMPGSHDKWQVFEIKADGSGLRQLTPTDQDDIHFYDPCWLPSGEIAMVSTAPLQGVPCNTGVIVGMMFKMEADGTGIRQIAFEQDHTYHPTVMPDGRILYLRWDYTDTPHVWNRILFTMNPDGSNQSEFYGSNSYWPNSLFFARPIPDHPTQFVGIVTGHHVGRTGEMILFDRAKGRRETEGVVQRIADRNGRVEPLIEDKLTQHSWPKFLHPYPLSSKYFLASCKPTPDSLWGIYLVDVFDNMVLLKEEEGRALLEPIPLQSTPRPPVIPEQTTPGHNEGTIFLADIYAGPGLQGIPRGTVKKLRVFTYHFAYQKQAGIQHRVGADGPWEVKQVLGTVAVEPDGSAFFRVPAKTPISLQPLDEEGKALQLMRSWVTVMPGEVRSCVGCHEDNAGGPPAAIQETMAGLKTPVTITPWYGAPRGFSFAREVQPVLDRYCVSCHDGSATEDGTVVSDLRGDQNAVWAYQHGNPDLVWFDDTPIEELKAKYSGLFSPSYVALREQIRVSGLESDLHLLPPMEFHADTSRLVQMLTKGHHGVQLGPEAWDRLITWIDLNAPSHGTWSEFTRIAGDQDERRCELRAMYGGKPENGETIIHGDPPFGGDLSPVVPEPAPVKSASRPANASGQVLDTAFLRNPSEVESDRKDYLTLDLGDDVSMRLVRIPSGRAGDEGSIDRPFWMGCFEVTNRQYAQIEPGHDSRFEHRGSWIFSEEYLGWPLNGPDQPVVRVSWEEAAAFCERLSERSGHRIRLPSEQQWEYACRAGAATPFWFGTEQADFSAYANLADRSLRRLAADSWNPKPPDLAARDDRFEDGHIVTAEVGSFAPNPFGLYDMHGNVAEWTLGHYGETGERQTVRGGSWRDLPADANASERFGYRPYQKVFHVGFRVVCEDGENGKPPIEVVSNSPFGVVCPWPGVGKAGIKWTRVGAGATSLANWPEIEKKPGVFDWKTADGELEAFDDPEGLSLLPILGYTPRWASKKPEEKDAHFYPPRDIRLFSRFVRQCVARYKHRVRVWEVWNEPNIDFFRGSVAEYAEIVKAAAVAARQADPTCRIAMGCAGVDVEFLRRLYEFGCGPYFDVMSVHPYQWGAEFNDGWMLSKLQSCRQLMDEFGDTHKEIWITEIGWSQAGGVTQQQQANLLVQSFVTALTARRRLRVEKIFWFCVKDWGGPGYGLFDTDGKPKPALTAYAALTTSLGEARYCGPWEAPENLRAHLFRRDGRPILVVWNPAAEGTVRFEIETQSPRILLRTVGNQQQELAVANGKATVDVTHAPLLITGLVPTRAVPQATDRSHETADRTVREACRDVWISLIPPDATIRPYLVLDASNRLPLLVHNDGNGHARGELVIDLHDQKNHLLEAVMPFEVPSNGVETVAWEATVPRWPELAGQLVTLSIRGSVLGEPLAPIEIPLRLTSHSVIEFTANSRTERPYLYQADQSGSTDSLRFGNRFGYRFDLKGAGSAQLEINVGANGANPWNVLISKDGDHYVPERSGKSWPSWQTICLDPYLPDVATEDPMPVYVKIQGTDCQVREIILLTAAESRQTE